MATMTLRIIEFPHQTRARTKETVRAVAWVSHRLNKRTWKSNNVTRDIQEAIYEQSDRTLKFEVDHITYVMEWLEQRGYAVRLAEKQRTREFHWLPDVNLASIQPITLAEKLIEKSRVETEARLRQVNVSMNGTGNPVEAKQVVVKVDKTEPTPEPKPELTTELPLPGDPSKPPLWDELEKKVWVWAQKKPMDYQKWAQLVIERIPD